MDQTSFEHLSVEILRTISVPGVFALAIVIIAKPLMPVITDAIRSWLSNRQEIVSKDHRKAIEKVQAEVSLLGSNHLHEVKDQLADIKNLLEKIYENTIYIRSHQDKK